MTRKLHIREVQCINCGKFYLRNNKRVRGGRRLLKGVRKMNTKTCSKECSKALSIPLKEKDTRDTLKSLKLENRSTHQTLMEAI